MFDEDWVGRYFIEEYSLVYISAFPSVAYRVNDKLSIAGSLALTYSNFTQTSAVPNLDPGIGDGELEIDADGTIIGFGVSALYEFTDRIRVGIAYQSELDMELEIVT